MRGIIHPLRSAAHRLACLSLYRSLLKQARRFQHPAINATLLRLIRHRFRLDRRIKSPTVISNALKNGRVACALVKAAADGSLPACEELTKTLQAAATQAAETTAIRAHHASLRSPPIASKAPKIAHINDLRTKEWAERIPKPIPISRRPVPQKELPFPDQPRQVPILRSMQGFPFLRYKSGPQSAKLSGVLNRLHQKELKRYDILAMLKRDTDLAELEDLWDENVHMYTGYRDLAGRDESFDRWVGCPLFATSDMQNTLQKEAQKKQDRAESMWRILQAETALAEEEEIVRSRSTESGVYKAEPGTQNPEDQALLEHMEYHPMRPATNS